MVITATLYHTQIKLTQQSCDLPQSCKTRNSMASTRYVEATTDSIKNQLPDKILMDEVQDGGSESIVLKKIISRHDGALSDSPHQLNEPDSNDVGAKTGNLDIKSSSKMNNSILWRSHDCSFG